MTTDPRLQAIAMVHQTFPIKKPSESTGPYLDRLYAAQLAAADQVDPLRQPLLTIHEVAQVFRVSPMTVYRMVERGEIQSVRIGRQFRVPRSALDAQLTADAAPLPAEAHA